MSRRGWPVDANQRGAMPAAARNKATRGELRRGLPVGFVWDAVQPVELDLAVSLAAIYRANHVLRLRAGQLLLELVPRGHHQWSFAFAGYVQERRQGGKSGSQ
jgi:hypothetical protein